MAGRVVPALVLLVAASLAGSERAPECRSADVGRGRLGAGDLSADDECGDGDAEDGGACALSALQRRAVSAVADTIHESPGRDEQAPAQQTVRILHISDTHNLHRGVQLPPADILIHTGDMTNGGKDSELADFNAWLGQLKGRYAHILVISGNHDWIDKADSVRTRRMDAASAVDTRSMKEALSNAQLLDHELVEVMGLKIWGSNWCPWFGLARPGDAERMEWTPEHKSMWQAWVRQTGQSGVNRYAEIPEGIDILLTHEPAYAIFDQTLDSSDQGRWGSSKELREAIMRTKPKVHLFGHDHEQRGQWLKGPTGQYLGGVEYRAGSSAGVFEPRPPPDGTYPVSLVSNNAMVNNPVVDAKVGHRSGPQHLVGTVRVIEATWSSGGWTFVAAPA